MHPYANLPPRNFWKRSISNVSWRDLNLNDAPKFKLQREDTVATAGSCFAQHIARYMRNAGMSPFTAEPAHALMSEFGGEVESYTQFSARYGNIYTIRQCLELLRQALGSRPMIEDFVEDNGRWFDLLRPNVVKQGFGSFAEAHADRAYHLSRVRVMFETTDVFVFTLGLTEAWVNFFGQYTYPVCPGTLKGQYLPDVHQFHNFSFNEVVADLEALIEELKFINSSLKIIFTVSPVPLVATYSDHNVLLASSYSKAVLRAAVGDVEARHSHVAYFPSYEIISHPASFGQYLASDLREVTERGVSHVMSCFLSTFYEDNIQVNTIYEPATTIQPILSNMPQGDAEALKACDEMYNDILVK